MTPPTPDNRGYFGIAKHLLKQDPLEPGDLPRYPRELGVKSYLVPQRGCVPTCVIEANELFVSPFFIGTMPAMHITRFNNLLKQYKGDEQCVIDNHVLPRAKDSIDRQIDLEALKVINAAVDSSHSITASYFDPSNISLAIGLLLEHETPPAAIVMAPQMFVKAEDWHDPRWETISYSPDSDTNRENAIYRGIKVYMSSMVPKNCIYVLADKRFVGVIPTRIDNHCCDAEVSQSELGLTLPEPSEDTKAWCVASEVGVAVVNDYCVVRIMVTDIWGGNPDQKRIGELQEKISNLELKLGVVDPDGSLYLEKLHQMVQQADWLPEVSDEDEIDLSGLDEIELIDVIEEDNF